MSFDLDDFMNQASAPMSTNFEVVGEGEYPFIIDGDPEQLKPKKFEGESKKTGQPYLFYQIELNCVCQDEAVKAKLGRDKVVVRLRMNLDLNEQGKLDNGTNKNVMMGQLRAALNQNNDGWTPKQFLGAGPFMGRVKNVSDSKDVTRKYADIVAVAPMRR